MKKLFIAICCLASLLCLTAFVQDRVSIQADDEKVIALRNVGHRILQQAGDYTSNLLPIQKLDNNSFNILFARPFTFVPDSLVKTVDMVFAKAGLNKQYLVKMINSHNNEIVYAYEVFNKPDPETISCLGRNQPVGPYFINITFGKPTVIAGLSQSYLLPGIGLLLSLAAMAIVGFYGKRPNPVASAAGKQAIALGSYTFYIDRGILKLDNAVMRLTAKETKVLKMFAQRPNTIIERQELVQHIWEDEGVVVGGRSLDVFVSKLRKKLAEDPNVSITNVHGVGYKLDVIV